MLMVYLVLFGIGFISSLRKEAIISYIVLFFVLFNHSFDSKSCLSNNLCELDFLSYTLVMLSIWLLILCLLSSLKLSKIFSSGFYLNMSLLLLSLVGSFSLMDYLYFYFSFESTLMPMLLMILGWGYQPERIEAGSYMLFYTVCASLPLFVVIMIKILSEGSSSIYFMSVEYSNQPMIHYLAVFSAFLVKFPMYSVHMWLPKAHVQAPLGGSMMLAGVLLKLGGYGIIRLMHLFKPMSASVICFLVSLSMWGGFIISLICLRQNDLKILIAYSSVAHMSMCIGGLMTLSELGYKGSILLMLGHGLASSGLFYLGGVVYSRVWSRSLFIGKGLVNLMPSMSYWWFMMVSMNIAAPPSLNLAGELSLMLSMVTWSYYMVFLIILLSFFSASYSLYLYSCSQHGGFLFSSSGMHSGCMLEYLNLFFHLAPLNLGILNIWFFC